MMMVPVTLGLVCALLLHTAAGECPGEKPTKQLFCYLREVPEQFDPCLCTHLVLQSPLDKLTPKSELLLSAKRLQGQNPSLRLVLQAAETAEVALKRRGGYAQTVAAVVGKCGLDGVEVALGWGKQLAAKVQLVDFVQTLSKELDKLEPKDRTKRSYEIHENIADDVVTPRWTPQSNRKVLARKTRETEEAKEDETTTASEEKDTTTETHEQQEIEEEEELPEGGKQIILHLTSEPQHLAKNFDLKRLSKYVSFYTLASDNLTDASERGRAYHPSRLMGIEDILNADSLIDLVTGLGAPHEKLVLTLPATALRFTLADATLNMPQSKVTGEPATVSRAELCKMMSEGEWTVERDEDLTAPYAYHDKTWVAFDDPTSVSIKGKYVLLRDLAGAAVRDADAEDWLSKCSNSSGPVLLQSLHDTFTHIARKSRAAQLVSLQEQLHSAGQFSYSGDVHLSPYRIVRVVDRAGSIHVVRKEAKTEFECSRQGYFRHPSGCNRFYRCVKFNQYTPDFTVFEYDCPAGLAFDETVEVCVWPGSLADGGACQGSSEIAPVPRSRYVCPQVAGYYADPENCRWFFACLDHQGDGSPLTAYEFRCPFGLVFDEQALVCNWPWLVPGCGGAGVYSARFTVGDFYEGRHRPSYASLSDVHVSGGRIENVPGGVVLGSAVSGIGSGLYPGSYASGSNVLGAGVYSAGAGGAHAYDGVGGLGSGSGSYLGGGAGTAYVTGTGGLASGSFQSNTVSGDGTGYSGGGAGAYVGKGLGYSAGGGAGYSTGGSGAIYTSGAGSGAGYSLGSGAYNGGAGSAGTVYTSGAGYNAGSGKYSSSYSAGSGGYGAGAGVSSTRYGSAGSYGSGAYASGGGYLGDYDNSGAYVEDNSGAYIHDSTGDTGGLYTGKASYGGQYTGGYEAGGAYVPGVYDNGAYRGSSSSGGQYKGSYVGGGDYSGSYDSGAYHGTGSTGGQYKGGYDTGSYFGQYDAGSYSGKYDSGAYSGKYDGGAYSGKYDGGAYTGSSDSGAYRGAGSYSGGSSYQGGYKVQPVATAVVTDGGYGSHDYNSVDVVEHKPAVGLIGLGAVKLSGGDLHSGGYVSSYVTPAPVPAVPLATVSPVVSGYSTVTPAPVSISSYSPSTVQPTTPRPLTYYPVSSSPVTPVTSRPLISYSTVRPPAYVQSYQQPSYVKTVTPAPPVYSYSTPTIGVVKTPVVPQSPVTYTYKQPVVKTEYVASGLQYSTPAPISSISYEQPSYVKTVTPAPYYEKAAVGYSYQKPLPPAYQPLLPSYSYEYSPPATYVQPVEVKYSYPKPAVLKTPIVPLNPIQYSTPAPIEYPVAPLKPDSYTFPASVVHPTPAPLPAIKYTPAVLKTPVVPLNPVQYSTPAPIHFQYSTPAPVKTVSYSTYSTPSPVVSYQTTTPLRPVSYSTPAPPVSYEYSTPRPVQPVRPLRPISYSTPAPFSVEYKVPTVLKTPVVPLNPVQYSTPAPVHFEYSTPAPLKPVSYVKPVTYTAPAPAVSYEYLPPAPVQPVSYVKPLKPVTYSTYTTPAPSISYEYSPPSIKPVVPFVAKTPVVPLNPIQYTTPAPPRFEVSYSTPAPVQPISYVKPVAPAVTYQYSTPAPPPVRPVTYSTYSTPAPAISYEYSPAPIQPVSYAKPLKPVTYSTVAPAVHYSAPVVTPTILKTPVVPLNPIQYTTPAPVHFEYSTPAPVPLKPLRPIAYTTPAPAVNYEYLPPAPVQPLKPLRPISYSTPAPQIVREYLPQPVQPVRPLRPITYTNPAPVVNYEYSAPVVKPVVPAVYKTPIVPLNPIQYTTPAPVHFEYSTPAPVPVQPIRPVTYSTPAPAVSYAPVPVQPVRPITYSTPAPVVSYAPVQPVRPVRPITLSSPAPFSYNYNYQPVKQVPTVLKTPVIPYNPVQYTTPAPAVFQYTTPAPVPTVSYVKPLRPVTYTTPAPAISYEYSTTAAPPPTVTYQPTSYVKPIPTVLKTPVVPLNPVQYSTPAPVINQYRFGAAYQNPEIQYQPEVYYKQPAYVKTQVVQEGYDYPKPSVKFVEGPKIVSTTPAPTITYTQEPVTPVYKQVYNYIKAPMVSAYEKVLNAISYSTTPAPLPVQQVTQSPVSYTPVTVGPSYSRPALVKTPSIPVTPVAVVPEYQKVLNVVKATTTPSPLYVNHYTSSYEQEVVPVSTPKPVVYKQRPAVYTETTYTDTYDENVDDLYDSLKSDFGTRLSGGYEEGYVYNQQKIEVPQVKVYTSTTPAPLPVFKETYKVRRPVKTYSQTYEQPAVAVGYEAGNYEGGSFYSSTPAPALVSSSEASFGAGEQFHKETSFTGYVGLEGDSIHYPEELPVAPVVTSTTQAPTVKITTARVSLPVVTPRPEGGYYVRKQKVRVRPVVTTENYPEIYSSTYPSTVSTTTYAPTYSTTPVPAVTFSTTGHPDDVVDVQGEDEEEEGVKLLEGYNGQYGGVVSQGGYSASSTVASIEDGEAIVGVLKKGRVTYDGRRTKTKVVVVSKLSDFNPLLVGKLGAECSCDGRSNALTIRRSKQRGSGRLFSPSRDSTIPDQQYVDTYLTSTSTAAPIVVNAESSSYESSSYESSSYDSPVVEIRPLRKKTRVYSTTTSSPVYSEVTVSEEPNFVVSAGSDRVKADSVECKRAGLFRHPNKCNKFYSCNWDQWKKKFTLHEFKCPIHLAYDVNLGACNWPSKGPACSDDNLLV